LIDGKLEERKRNHKRRRSVDQTAVEQFEFENDYLNWKREEEVNVKEVV